MAGLRALVVIASPVPVHGNHSIESSFYARSWPSQPQNEIFRGQKHSICIKKHITKPLKPLVRCSRDRAGEQPDEEQIKAAIEEKEAEKNTQLQSKILSLASEEAVEGPQILHEEAREVAEEIADEIGESVEKTADLLEKKVEEFTQEAAESATEETFST